MKGYKAQMVSRELRRVSALTRKGTPDAYESALEGLRTIEKLIIDSANESENIEESGNSGNKTKLSLKKTTRSGTSRKSEEDIAGG